MQEEQKKKEITYKVKSTYCLLLLFFLETWAKEKGGERGKTNEHVKMAIFTQSTQGQDRTRAA